MDSKKAKIISIVSVIALAAILVGATYAYFQAQTGEGSQTDIKINANTVDTFTFETGDPLSINLNQENFASGKGNQTGSTYAKAILTANNKTNSATNKYYLYLNISNNTFGYTQDKNTPEIILTIKDGSNTELTRVTGLTYKTVTDGKGNTITGFDITNKDGLITIFNNRSITTTSTIEETWNVTVTFVNYNLDQSANAGKSFNAKLMIQKEKIPINLSEVCKSGDILADCIIAFANKSFPSVSNIYHHDANLTNGANDDSYRYAGTSPFNFVTIDGNNYRIIGVVDGKVKVISESLIENMSWNSDSWSTWAESSLNAYLNETYLNQLGDLNNNIDTVTWKVGNNAYENILSVPSMTYQNEIVSPASSTTYEAKIGLMYVSDYGFSAQQKAWNLGMSNYDNTIAANNNWLYNKKNEWTISSRDESNKYYVTSNGNIGDDGSPDDSSMIARPVFYLSSNVKYAGGTGLRVQTIKISY